MAYSLRWTGRLLKPLQEQLYLLRDQQPYYQSLVWQHGVYLPPGLWYKCPPVKTSPLLCWLPPPHHPLELLAARKGLGGPWTDDGEKVKEGYEQLRGARWHVATHRYAAALNWTDAQARLVYHLLTPMSLPEHAATWDESAGVMVARLKLYKAAGLAYKDAWYAEDEALRPPEGCPRREDLWTKEITGEVEL